MIKDARQEAYILYDSMPLKFKNRQSQLMMEVRLGFVFGEGVMTGQGHGDLLRSWIYTMSGLGGAYGVYIFQNSSS